MGDVFDSIFGQPKVREFFRATISSGRVTHAYLFTGPAGSNKTAAAYAFAQAIICKDHGCGECDDCKRAQRRAHPDIRYYAPEGVHGYLVEQIRTIVADSMLAPIRARCKVYILDRVDLLGTQAANAFLKTLEEPPEGVVFILLGRTHEAVLPTIVSRCQVVPFRHIPATQAAGIVSQNTGTSPEFARISIEACDGSITNAFDFARSNERKEFRRRVIEILESLEHADSRDVLEYAQELIERSKAPLDNVRTKQEEELSDSEEFLARSAIKQIEARQKRALSAASVRYLGQLTAIIRSWLRDLMVISAQTPELVVNVDCKDYLAQTASRISTDSIIRVLRETYRCDEAIAYNVSPETCLDVLLFEIRKVLHGSSSAH